MIKGLQFESLLARRFLEENKMQTLMIILGISIGVAVMFFLTALIDGLQADLIQKTVGRAPHIVITNRDNALSQAVRNQGGTPVLLLDTTQKTLRPIVEWRNISSGLTADKRIKAVLPIVDGSALIRRGQVSRSVLLKGMELNLAERIYGISSSIIVGSPNMSEGAVLLGKDLAADLGVTVGDPILLEVSGQQPLSIIVDGVFDLGSSAINQRWLVMDRSRVSSLLGIGDRATSIEIQVEDVLAAETIAREWSARIPTYQVTSWQESNATLLSALRSQSSSSYTIQFFVLLAVTLGVASVLAISAVQKSKQIGILKAMGIRTNSVARVFLLQGLVLGTLGTVVGLGLGLLMSQAFIVLAGQGYGLLLKPVTAAIIITATIMASGMSAYLPARGIARISPIEVIRNG